MEYATNETASSFLEHLRAVTMGIAFFSLITVSVSGNMLVCLSILWDARLRRQENIFLFSLAVSDILVALLVMTFAALNDIMGRWIFGAYCSVWLSSDVMCSTASILHLSAISFDRYLHIRQPLKYAITMTRLRVYVIVAMIWLVSASISFIPFSLNLHKRSAVLNIENFSRPSDHCILDINLRYAVGSSMVSFYIPCVIMLLLYRKLYNVAQSHSRIVKQQYRCFQSAMMIAGSLASVSHQEQFKRRLTKHDPILRKSSIRRTGLVSDNKARRTIGIIVGIFIAMWLPFFVVNIVNAGCKCIPFFLFQTVTWIGYANSIANPIIYTVLSRDFRNAFKRILRIKRPTRCYSQSIESTTPRKATVDKKISLATHGQLDRAESPILGCEIAV